MQPLNILCCSTRQWNPGDEWIALGIRRLMQTCYNRRRPLNWILYDRSPDCFVEPWRSGERRPGLLGNSFQPHGSLPPVDLAIAAGTPEWSGPHFEPLFSLPDASSLPWFFLGVDVVHSGPLQLTEAEHAVLSGALIVTRGRLGHKALRELQLESTVLPCPSLFCAERERPARILRSLAVVVQDTHVLNQSIGAELRESLLPMIEKLKQQYEVAVVCNYLDEFTRMGTSLGVPVRYVYDSHDYLPLLTDFDAVITTRLHSAFLANSLLKPAVVLDSQSARIASAVELYPYVYTCEPEQVGSFLQGLDCDAVTRNLLNWKRDAEQKYQRLLTQELEKYGLYSV